MISPKIKTVNPSTDFTLLLEFANGEKKIFDVKPYLEKGIFKELRNENQFMNVKTFLGSIQWEGGQDFSPDTLYLESKTISE